MKMAAVHPMHVGKYMLDEREAPSRCSRKGKSSGSSFDDD